MLPPTYGYCSDDVLPPTCGYCSDVPLHIIPVLSECGLTLLLTKVPIPIIALYLASRS